MLSQGGPYPPRVEPGPTPGSIASGEPLSYAHIRQALWRAWIESGAGTDYGTEEGGLIVRYPAGISSVTDLFGLSESGIGVQRADSAGGHVVFIGSTPFLGIGRSIGSFHVHRTLPTSGNPTPGKPTFPDDYYAIRPHYVIGFDNVYRINIDNSLNTLGRPSDVLTTGQ